MNAQRKVRSQLFTLRLWTEPGVLPPNEIRFRVQHLPSGEVRYFRDWSALIAYLTSVFGNEEEHTIDQHNYY